MIDIEESQKALKAQGFKYELIDKAKEEYPHIRVFIELFEELLLSIEISSFNGQVTSVQNLYFPRHPVFEYLADETRDRVMFEVGRGNRRDKLITLQDHYEEINEEVQWFYDLKYNNFKCLGYTYDFSITSEKVDNVRKVARFTSYAICTLMLMLILVEHDMSEQESYFTFFYWYEKAIMRFICSFQLFLTFLFFGLWVKMRLPLCLSKLRKQQEEEAGEEEPSAEEE